MKNIDRIIESVLREHLIIEGLHVGDYRKRAMKALLARNVDEAQAKEWEEWFYETYFTHGTKNNIVRLEEFFASAAAEVGFDNGKVSRLIEILEFIKRNWQKDGFYDISKLNRNNASSYEQLNGLFGSMVDEEKQNDEALANSQDGTSIADGYSVMEVTSFEDANEIGNYSCPGSELCFTQGEGTWNNYTNYGENECYVILRDGYEKMNFKDYLDDPNRPFDDYGLSMIFLFIKPNGEIATSNTRWNHNTGGKFQGNVDQSFTKGDIAKLLGVNFDAVFKPGQAFEDKHKKDIEDAMQRIANGEDPKDVFDICGYFYDDIARVLLFDKCNYINSNGVLLSPNKWFDWCNDFKNGFGKVRKNHLLNFVNMNGEVIYKPEEPEEWFDSCLDFQKNGVVKVAKDDKYNFLNTNGELLSPNLWFDWCELFNDGLSIVKLKDKKNYLKLNGELLSPNQWFDKCNNFFYNGFAIVRLDGKYNFINTNGEVIYKPEEPEEWFEDCLDFTYGFGRVKLDGKWNHLKSSGGLLSRQWFDYCWDFKNGFARVQLNGKYNLMNDNCEYLSDQWYDYCWDFGEGFAVVILDNKCNYIDKNGNILSPNQWFDECWDFKNGFAKVIIDGYDGDGEEFYIDKDGNLHKERPQVSESRIMTRIISESIRMTLRQLI